MTKLDEIMIKEKISNHALVEVLPANLNHKIVQKARTGKKPIAKHSQDLIIKALNILLNKEFKLRREDVFLSSFIEK